MKIKVFLIYAIQLTFLLFVITCVTGYAYVFALYFRLPATDGAVQAGLPWILFDPFVFTVIAFVSVLASLVAFLPATFFFYKWDLYKIFITLASVQIPCGLCCGFVPIPPHTAIFLALITGLLTGIYVRWHTK